MDADAVLKWLGEVVAVGGSSAAITLGLLKFLGQKWIDKRLNRSLEAFKSEQQRELERHKQFLTGRIGEIHKKEFEVFQKAWQLLQQTYGAEWAQVMIRKNPPLLEADLRNILSLNEELLKEGVRAQKELGNYLIEHRIFMTKDLWNKFHEVNQDLLDAINACQGWRWSNHFGGLEFSKEKLLSLDGKINAIAEAVQARLHYEEA